jgi:ribosome biogenesis SPOUT family RNA methylase Rps3
MKFIIEHLEDEVWDWCVLEYKHMSSIVGKDNLIFTNVPQKEAHKLEKFGTVHTESVRSLKLNLAKCCLMEMVTDKVLVSSDKNKFDYFIFGGILGDHPPQGRTKVLHDLCEMRSLGREQMSTDTAVLVTHMILDGKKLSDIEFKDTIELELKDGEDIQLPYRYVIQNGKPVLPPGLFEMLRDQEGL